jgi:hypothetical protein
LTNFNSKEYLDLNIIKSLKVEGEQVGEWTKLAEKVANVFSQLDYLSSSFLQVLMHIPVYKIDHLSIYFCLE